MTFVPSPKKKYLDEFILISKWSANSVGDNGEIFAFPENKGLKRFSAMAQGSFRFAAVKSYRNPAFLQGRALPLGAKMKQELPHGHLHKILVAPKMSAI